jgi:hypothetical protein
VPQGQRGVRREQFCHVHGVGVDAVRARGVHVQFSPPRVRTALQCTLALGYQTYVSPAAARSAPVALLTHGCRGPPSRDTVEDMDTDTIADRHALHAPSMLPPVRGRRRGVALGNLLRIVKKSVAPRDHGPSFTCTRCSVTSHKPDDVELRYCRTCRAFCDLMDIHDRDGVVTVWNR